MSTVTATNGNAQYQIDPLTGKVGSAAQSAAAASSSSSAKTPLTGNTSSLANESTFLTLLVAQLKNQDPSQPADGTQFVTQLAQFTSLEQNLAMRTDLDSIDKKIPALPAVPAASNSTKQS
jgi:flagellar basal-body rod modification protein FlgD